VLHIYVFRGWYVRPIWGHSTKAVCCTTEDNTWSLISVTICLAFVHSQNWSSCSIFQILVTVIESGGACILYWHHWLSALNWFRNTDHLYNSAEWGTFSVKIDVCRCDLYFQLTLQQLLICVIYTAWLKKMDSISYVYIYLNYTWYVNDLHNIWKRRS